MVRSDIGSPSWRLVSPVNVWIIGIILAALFAIGTVFDFQISTALYNPESTFGILGAAYGEYPFAAALLIGGIMLVMFRDPRRKQTRVLQVFLGMLLGIIGGLMLVINPLRYISGSVAVVIVVNLVITAAIIWGTIVYVRGVDRSLAVQVAAVFLAVAITEIVVVNILKISWERPRMRMLMEFPEAGFAPWWHLGNPQREELSALGVISEEFKSFPSAHTANATVIMVFAAFAVIKPHLRKALPWLFWLGALWGILVGMSRIIVGAHFLTDTVGGFAVTLVCVLVAFRVGFRKVVDPGPLVKAPN